MRISDWSSDVCSSDLPDQHQRGETVEFRLPRRADRSDARQHPEHGEPRIDQRARPRPPAITVVEERQDADDDDHDDQQEQLDLQSLRPRKPMHDARAVDDRRQHDLERPPSLEMADDRRLREIVQRRAEQEMGKEHTSELQSLMRNSYAVFCLQKQKVTIKGNRSKHNQPKLQQEITTS